MSIRVKRFMQTLMIQDSEHLKGENEHLIMVNNQANIWTNWNNKNGCKKEKHCSQIKKSYHPLDKEKRVKRRLRKLKLIKKNRYKLQKISFYFGMMMDREVFPHMSLFRHLLVLGYHKITILLKELCIP